MQSNKQGKFNEFDVFWVCVLIFISGSRAASESESKYQASPNESINTAHYFSIFKSEFLSLYLTDLPSISNSSSLLFLLYNAWIKLTCHNPLLYSIIIPQFNLQNPTTQSYLLPSITLSPKYPTKYS
jgi:hypothetical protein